MPQANVVMTVRTPVGSASIIDIEGEITGFAEDVLMNAYSQATSDGVTYILLNFNGLAYMNSSGIGLLVTLLIRARRQGQRLAAFGLSAHYQQIFELTRLVDAIGIYPGEEEALNAAR